MTDLRVTAACIKAQFTGTNDSAQGIIAAIDNLPADIFDKVGVWPSVDQMMAMASTAQRIGLLDHEVVYREPDTEIAHELSDGAWVDATTTTQPTVTARTHQSRVIGFVWSGAASNAQLRFEFTQIVEGQPKRWVNVVPTPPKSAGPNPKPTVHAILDKVKPGWTQPTVLKPWLPTVSGGAYLQNGVLHMGNEAAKGAADAAGNAFKKVLGIAGKAVGGWAAQRALGYVAEEALPLLLV
jgi:hypothetical protein